MLRGAKVLLTTDIRITLINWNNWIAGNRHGGISWDWNFLKINKKSKPVKQFFKEDGNERHGQFSSPHYFLVFYLFWFEDSFELISRNSNKEKDGQVFFLPPKLYSYEGMLWVVPTWGAHNTGFIKYLYNNNFYW